MREYKFRAYDLQGEQMRYDITGFEFFNDGEMSGIFIDGDFYDKKEIALMQYTGIKDENGKEIYEGDIVTGIDYPFIDEGKQNYVGIVVFYDDTASFGYEYQCVRKDKRGISNGINNEFEANENLVCEDLEVIGNIYENKELLNETDR